MKTKILLSTIAILFVSLLGSLYLNLQQTPPVSNLSPTPTAPINNLKTYTNKEYGFEFSYPESWSPVQNEKYTIISRNNNRIIARVDVDISSTISDYLVKADKISSTAYEGQPSIQVQSTKKTVINNLNCIQRQEYLNSDDTTQTVTYFKKGSQIVSLILLNTPGSSLTLDTKDYNQILSTFKFIP